MKLELEERQTEALKALVRKVAHDPGQFRLIVVCALLVLGYTAVTLPLIGRLGEAREARALGMVRNDKARALAHYMSEFERFGSVVANDDDLVDWQNYVLAKLNRAQVQLISLEPKTVQSQSAFRIVGFELVARAKEYADLVEFVGRLEHGQRAVRIEEIHLAGEAADITLTCSIKGLVRETPSASPEGDHRG